MPDGYLSKGADQFWQLVFDALPYLVFTSDLEQTVLQANQALAEVLKTTPEALIGRKSFEYFHHASAPQVLQEGQPQTREFFEPELKIYLQFTGALICNEAGHPIGTVHIGQDITAQKLAEISLRQDEEHFRMLFQNAPLGYQSLNEEGYFIDVNQAWLDLLGYERDQVIGRWFGDFLAPEYVDHFRQNFPRFKAIGEIDGVEFEIVRATGDRRLVSFTGRIGKDAQGDFRCTHCILADITERKNSEQKLMESEARLSQVIKQMPYPVEIRTPEGDATTLNDAFLTTFGLPQGENISPVLNEAMPVLNNDLLQEAVGKVRLGEVGYIPEMEICFDDFPPGLKPGRRGRAFFDVTLFPVMRPTGEIWRIVTIWKEITASKAAEEKLRESLSEKEVLLKEIHHRVKNNLQIVNSMLSLQAEKLSDPREKAMFADAGNRVQSMAFIHELLYLSPDLARLNFREYIETLSTYLFRSYGIDPALVQLVIDIEGVALPVESAIPCGLIINELVTNSLKYAFPAGRRGQIQIRMRQDAHSISLAFSDDGTGIPEGVDFENSDTLGLALVYTLVKQLHGDLHLDGSHGTSYSILLRIDS